MNSYSFTSEGHPNVLGTHKNTLEITKENFLTKNGDCILGINADFDFAKLRQFISGCKTDFIRIELKTGSFSEKVSGKLNKDFSDEKSIVIRKSNFISERTLITESDKSAGDLPRELIRQMKKPDSCLKIIITAN